MTVANNTTDLRYGVTGELGCKAPCRGATITNITLEGEQTANGIAFVEGDPAFVNGQTNQTENGVYIVSTSAWTRAVWFDDELDVIPGTLVTTAGEGTQYPNTIFETICADNPIVFGTSAITFQVKASGTNTGDKAVVLTGPITGTSSELVLGTLTIPTVITDNSVTNAKLAQVATATFKGRTTASTGNVEDLTVTQATALLNNVVGDSGSGGTKGLVPAPAAGDTAAGKFLKADGTWEVPPEATQATESLAGIAEIATQAETDAGTDDLRIITPLKLKTTRGYCFFAQDQKASGSSAGTSIGGFNTRVLNTVVKNTISGASLATNTITLPAGTYRVWASAQAYAAGPQQLFLYNSSDSTTVLNGSSQAMGGSGNANSEDSIIYGDFTIASTKNFILRQWIRDAVADGLGASSGSGIIEVYAQILIELL